MLNNEFWPVWVVSAGVVVPLVAVVVVCICGCRKTVPKNELLGLAGVVKITNPEERLNHNHEPTENSTSVSGHNNTRDSNDISRRSTTANRSLPDIPIDPNHRSGIRETLWEHEPNGDTSSELYATVEENKQQSQPLVANAVTPLQGLEPSPDRESDQTDSFSTYARVPVEHPYDKLKSSEHPYAQVGGTSQILDTVNPEGSEEHEQLRNGNVQNVNRDPVPPPRSRRGTSQSSLVSTGTLASVDIPAATAIAGGIHASQDLPYMTPPINYSGDSQDNKGYTSISVREPLETIKAQTREAASQKNRTREITYPDYASVVSNGSDDSAKNPHVTQKKITFYGTQLYMLNQNYAYEMYAAIDDPGPVYTSGSETYAQIQSTVTETVPTQELPVISLENSGDSGSAYPPQPPSVDSLKHVAQAHSRQASSSSATSSVVNLGSPKPEKRQANSPLPAPPPVGSPDLRLTLPQANLEEMYAKVVKVRRRAVSMPEAESTPVVSHPADDVSRLSVEADDCHDTVPRVEIDSDSLCSISLDVVTVPLSPEGRSESDSAFTSINEKGLPEEEYESRKNRAESFKSSEPGYESVFPTNLLLTYDPGYEQVNQLERNPSDCDPNYEPLRLHLKETVENEDSVTKIRDQRTVVRETVFNMDNEFVPNYAHVNSTNSHNVDEPNYESMTSESHEPNYAVVSGSVGDESDSNYEVVVQDDPNYESVNYFDVNNIDPPYERLHNEEAKDSDNDTISGYEKVKLQNSASSNEFGNQQSSDDKNSRSDAGYEEVGRSVQSITDASLNSVRAEDLYSKVIKANTRM